MSRSGFVAANLSKIRASKTISGPPALHEKVRATTGALLCKASVFFLFDSNRAEGSHRAVRGAALSRPRHGFQLSPPNARADPAQTRIDFCEVALIGKAASAWDVRKRKLALAQKFMCFINSSPKQPLVWR